MQVIQSITQIIKEEKYKKLIGYLCLFSAVLAAALIMIKARVEDRIIPYATFVENRDEEQFIRNLTTGMTLEQKFTSPRDFACITLSCSNHEKTLPGSMFMEVFDQEGRRVAVREVQNETVRYDVPVEIPFEGQKNRLYTIRVTALDTEEEAIGFFGYHPDRSSQNTVLLNGEKTGYVLSIGTHNYTGLFRDLLWLLMIIMFLGLAVLLLLLWKKEISPQQAFLLLAVPMSVALLCFMSVNFINDGDVHFSKAYHYANVILGVGGRDTRQSIAMRRDDVDTLYSSVCLSGQHAQNMQHIYENWSWFVKDAEMVYNVEWREAGVTGWIGYVPSILAIVLSRILHLGTYPMIYLAKIAALICYLAGCYYAIKITPVGKHIMVFLAALPMSLQQATGITYDNITYIALFLLISLYFKIYFDGMTKKLGIFLLLSCMLLGSCKGGIYAPVLLLLLFLPGNRFGGIKKKLLYILLAGALTAGILAMSYGSTIWGYIHPAPKEKPAVMQEEELSAEASEEITEGSAEALEEITKEPVEAQEEITKELSAEGEPAAQRYGISYMWKSPGSFVKLLINTLIERVGYYMEGISGRMAAWAVEQLPLWSCALFGVILLLSKNGIGEENYRLNVHIRTGMLLTFGVILLVFYILFLIETPLYYPYIWGIQGRYFIPQLMLLLLAFRNNHVTQRPGSEHLLYAAYYSQMIFFTIGYFYIFMIQTYSR